MDGACPDIDRDVLERDDSLEPLRHPANRQDVLLSLTLGALGSARDAGQAPRIDTEALDILLVERSFQR